MSAEANAVTCGHDPHQSLVDYAAPQARRSLLPALHIVFTLVLCSWNVLTLMSEWHRGGMVPLDFAVAMCAVCLVHNVATVAGLSRAAVAALRRVPWPVHRAALLAWSGAALSCITPLGLVILSGAQAALYIENTVGVANMGIVGTVVLGMFGIAYERRRRNPGGS